MTGRGKRHPDPPPSPEDPSLQDRPFPRQRSFAIRSFGPGITLERVKTSQSYLDQLAQAASAQDRNSDDCRMLEDIVHQEEVYWREDQDPLVTDPTWGYYVFLTDYAPSTINKLPLAMENLVKTAKQWLTDDRPQNVYAEELFSRLKLDLVHDSEALEGASHYRVRKNFRALLRGLDLVDEDGDDCFGGGLRNHLALIIDGDDVRMLADVDFAELHDLHAFKRLKIKALDVYWTRPERTGTNYRGVLKLPITELIHDYNSFSALNLEDRADMQRNLTTNGDV